MICFVFCVHFQSAEMSYASVAMTCAGPIGGGKCPSKHYVKAKSKYDPKDWSKDQDKDEGGNVVCGVTSIVAISEVGSDNRLYSIPLRWRLLQCTLRSLVLFAVVFCALGCLLPRLTPHSYSLC